MSLTDRDRKIVVVLVPLLVLAGYWFLLLAPKREEASKAADALAKQEQRRDAAQQRVDALASSKTSFASDYAELVRLGKAVPSKVDMPSLIVQLDKAARGTGISFSRIATGERSATPAPAPPPKAPGSGDGSQPAAAGGQGAASGSGQAAEAAGNATNSANAASAEKSGVNPSDTQTSGQARDGAVPVGGGSATPGGAQGAGAAAAAPGLETVPLELEFKGNFFNLADFFHRLKRFVRVANDRVLVRGRLLTVDTLKFASDPELFPKLKAEVTATVYLSPKAGGPSAGATQQGPPGAAPAAGSAAPAGSATTPPAPTSTPTP